MTAVCAVAVPGLPEIGEGADLAAEIVRACAAADIGLTDADVVVVASKVVAKAEGRSVAAADRSAAISQETVREVASRALPDGRVTRVVESRTGPVLAAAGVDASDVEQGTVLLLPADPDASARALRTRLRQVTGASPAVLVSDTAGRPWRDGVTDFALGAAGLTCQDDVRGKVDRFGRPLEVTVRAIGDEVASLADLVKGKASGTPVAVVRGLGAYVSPGDGAGTSGCVRTGPTNWFAYGHVEAAWAALGVASGDVPPPAIDPASEDVATRVERATIVARAGAAPSEARVHVEGKGVRVDGDPVAVGMMVQRLFVALWAERLEGDVAQEHRRSADVVRVVVAVRERVPGQ